MFVTSSIFCIHLSITINNYSNTVLQTRFHGMYNKKFFTLLKLIQYMYKINGLLCIDNQHFKILQPPNCYSVYEYLYSLINLNFSINYSCNIKSCYYGHYTALVYNYISICCHLPQPSQG